MSVLPALPGIIQAGAQLGTSVAQAGMALENYEYMKGVQKKTWEREDNSIQRRVADLKAAGLSPVLAAGQGAAVSAPVKLEVPNLPKIEPVSVALNLMQQKANIAQTAAQTEKLRQDALGQDLANQFAVSTNPISTSLKRLEEEERYQMFPNKMSAYTAAAARELIGRWRDEVALEKEKYDLSKWQDFGLPTNGGLDPSSRIGAVGINALMGILDKIWSKLP